MAPVGGQRERPDGWRVVVSQVHHPLAHQHVHRVDADVVAALFCRLLKEKHWPMGWESRQQMVLIVLTIGKSDVELR